jgi:nicotinamidase-related amidase
MPGSQKRKYKELTITGPPLYNQGMVSDCDESKTTDSSKTGCLSLDASRTALLIVDVQPEYWSECPAVRKDFAHFPSKMSSLIQICRKQGAKCIWVRADYAYDRSPWLQQFSRLHQGRIPPVVKFNSKWEKFAEPSDGDLIITKNSWSSTTDTGLLDTLSKAGIDTVLVCGLITSVCVQHSAFGVFEAGFRTILVTDACADRGKERHQAALALYGDYMYELRTVESIRDELHEEEKPISFDMSAHAMVESKSLPSMTTSF